MLHQKWTYLSLLFCSTLLLVTLISLFRNTTPLVHATANAPVVAIADKRPAMISVQTGASSPHLFAQGRLPTTPQHFVLAGTQPGNLTVPIPDPQDCKSCHTAAIYERWRGSMMAQAGRDPLFWAAVTVANDDAPFSGEFCLRCHTPGGWLEGRSQPPDGSSLNALDLQSGVACEICHRMVDPVAATSTSDQLLSQDAQIRTALTMTVAANQLGSARLIMDPNDNRRGPFRISGAPHTAFQTDFLSQSTDAVTRARVCGTCHTIENPALVWTENPPNGAPAQFWPRTLTTQTVEAGDLFPIETTYDEWLSSDYAKNGVIAPDFAGAKADGVVAACQDCHMKRSTGRAATAGVVRDCQTTGCLPEHTLVGGNTWVPQLVQDTRWRLHTRNDSAALNATILDARAMLQKAATITATLTVSGTAKVANVRIVNQSGHKLPTGYAEGRRMWLHVQAFDDKGGLVFESGAYDPATGILGQDAALKRYEVEQGLTPELAQLVGLAAGPSFHFVLNNTVYKDNRIPPRGYTKAAFDQPGLRPVAASYADGQYWDDTQYVLPTTAASIQVMLYYQTASKEYIDFLRTNGGSDGDTLGKLWDDTKSPPELMALTFYPIKNIYLPFIRR